MSNNLLRMCAHIALSCERNAMRSNPLIAQTNLCSTGLRRNKRNEPVCFLSFSQHRLGNRVKGTLGRFYGNDKRGSNANLDNRRTSIFWNTGCFPLLFSLIADYKKRTLLPIPLSYISLGLRRTRKGEKPIKQWIGVSQEFWAVGLSVHPLKRISFFCAHRAFVIRVLNIHLFLDLDSPHLSACSIHLNAGFAYFLLTKQRLSY